MALTIRAIAEHKPKAGHLLNRAMLTWELSNVEQSQGNGEEATEFVKKLHTWAEHTRLDQYCTIEGSCSDHCSQWVWKPMYAGVSTRLDRTWLTCTFANQAEAQEAAAAVEGDYDLSRIELRFLLPE